MISPAQIRQLLEQYGITPTFLADGTGVLLDVDGHQVLSLNHSASFLVEMLLAGEEDPQTLQQRFAEEFGLPASQAEHDIAAFLDTLRDKITAKRD
jgi:hypothetical protein